MSIISCPGDKFMIKEANVSVSLDHTRKQSDTLAKTDIRMTNLYALTYLLFKHGTLTNRRIHIVFDEYLYRTALTMIVQIIFFVANGLSHTDIYGKLFYPLFMVCLTPIQFWIEAITHSDYGFHVFYRIFGEYKHN